MKKFWRILIFGLLTLLIVSAAGFLIWANTPPKPEAQALDSLQSTQGVQYTNINGWLTFIPTNPLHKTGLILYPGGRIDYRSYTPHARAIAQAGYTVVVVPMPLNFAFLGVNRANDVINTFPTIENWAVGGHSLGGAMAAEFVNANLDRVGGLVLWASYPAESTDLSNSGLAVISISASNDGLTTRQEILNSHDRLPRNSVFLEIQGGNHAGFGWYGAQKGDGPLEIAKTDQQAQIVTGTTQFLNALQD